MYKDINEIKANNKRQKVQEYVDFNASLTSIERMYQEHWGFPDMTFEQCVQDKRFAGKYNKMVEYRDGDRHQQAVKVEERTNAINKRYAARCQCELWSKEHSLRFDACYCPVCNVWLESRCCDGSCEKSYECNFGEHCFDEERRCGCEFCSDRPFSPMAADGTHPDYRTDIQGGSDVLLGIGS